MRKIYLLLLVPLLFLVGCTQQQSPTKQPSSSIKKCNLPSTPGKLEINLLGFPDEIVAEGGSNIEYSFDLYVKNYILNEIKNFKIGAYPSVGAANIDDTSPPPSAEYMPDSGIIPGEKTYTVTVNIPGKVAGIGSYTLVIKTSYSTSTNIEIPICIGYDPKITKIDKSAMACDPTEIPKPCYSPAPVIPSSINVKPYGASKYSKYKIEIHISDAYGILKEERGIKKIKIDDISLVIDNKEIKAGSDVFRCTPSIGRTILYPTTNTIICYVDLNKLKQQCKGSECYVDDDVLKIGKGALIKIKLSYDVLQTKKYGPARIIVYESGQ